MKTLGVCFYKLTPAAIMITWYTKITKRGLRVWCILSFIMCAKRKLYYKIFNDISIIPFNNY